MSVKTSNDMRLSLEKAVTAPIHLKDAAARNTAVPEKFSVSPPTVGVVSIGREIHTFPGPLHAVVGVLVRWGWVWLLWCGRWGW